MLLAILFTAAGDAAASGRSIFEALKLGFGRMQEVGGANLGDRTMVDALYPAFDALDVGAEAASLAARKGANQTAHMRVALAGRASYVSGD